MVERYALRIGGERRESAQVDVVTSPYDREPVGEVCIGTARDMDDAIACAHASFAAFRRTPTHERAAVLERVSDGLRARGEEFALRMAREGGKPIRLARGEVARAALTFELAAGEARRMGGEVLPIDLEARAEGRLCAWVRVPRGPVAAIAPFNFPLNLVAHKLAPAIAVGAPVVLKPPPQCPLSGLALGELCVDAGLPDGALSVVPCAPEVAQRLVEDERMKVLSFTGSDTVGWKLAALAGKKQVLLELGGNAPCIVDEGVDLDACLAAIVPASFAHAGQVCIKVQRVLVHASLFEEFLERFVAAAAALPCGDPLREETIVGPLIADEHVERVQAWIREAVAGGATLFGGGLAEPRVLRPAVLTGATSAMRVCKDEIFGPVTLVEPFTRFEQALALCNATRFGLQAGVFTPDLAHALAAFRELDYGGVVVNDVPTFRVDNFPYGGTKDSGTGREGVRFAMEEMTAPKVLVLRGLPG